MDGKWGELHETNSLCGLAFGCIINRETHFDRKNYYYPQKNLKISFSFSDCKGIENVFSLGNFAESFSICAIFIYKSPFFDAHTTFQEKKLG